MGDLGEMKKCIAFLASLAAASCATLAENTPIPEAGAPYALTQGPHEHFLASYFAIDSYDPSMRYVLVLETDVNGRLPEANERCTLGVVDRRDGNRFIPVTTTACWNFQEAAMAFWMNEDEILFNDVRDGRFVAVVMNWRTKRERVLPHPVSAVSEDRTWAVSVNYARLSLTRPDYGYAGPGQDAQKCVTWPEDDGLWTMDLRTGASKMILPVSACRAQMPPVTPTPDKPGRPLAYYCHTVISKDGAKIFFLARSVDWFDETTHEKSSWHTTAFTVNRDGTGLRRCFGDGWGSSHFNWAPDGSHKMVVTAHWGADRRDGKGADRVSEFSLVEFSVGEEDKVRQIGRGVLNKDWHCVYSPDGKFISAETYWDRDCERPWVLIRASDGLTRPIGSFFVPEAYRGGYWRCDLHARWRRDGGELLFNSVHEGSRQVYAMDVGPARRDISLAGAGWTADGFPVRVPHTWNAQDAADGLPYPSKDPQREWSENYSGGAGTYLRKETVYRRSLPDPRPGKRYFVKCMAASTKAEVRVNGVVLGRHVGAYNAFAFEATDALKESGNVLEISVSNVFDPVVQPVHGDFSCFGGLYRDVRWIETDRVCIDPVTDGADGVVLDADPETGVVTAQVRVLGGTNEVQRFAFGKPELWSPENPRLYDVVVRVRQQGCRDELKMKVGFRKAEFRPDGFYLNGAKRKLRGVCLHQDREGKGPAASAEDEAEDVRIIKAMGADAVRAVHYPHSRSFLDLCDREGLLVWSEVPNVGRLTFADSALTNAVAEAREMVAQRRNNACVFAWGVYNEIAEEFLKERSNGDAFAFLKVVRDEIRAVDPSRPTVAASNKAKRGLNALTDQLGMNLYPGWYGAATSEMMDEAIAGVFADNDRNIIAVSEYGGGGSPFCHADPVDGRPVRTDGPCHPEEYQAWHHRCNYKAIRADDRIWGSFIWQMFDSGSDAKQEGTVFGRNDKGLVTYDRQTPKDAFFFYQANWSDNPVVHLTGARMTEVAGSEVNVLGFSNAGPVTFRLNGLPVGTLKPDEVKSVLWRNVKLMPGNNYIELEAGGMVSRGRWLCRDLQGHLGGTPYERRDWAATWTEPRVFTNSVGKTFNYRWFAPKAMKPGAKYPLVVFLHGAGERGDDNLRPLIHGVPQFINWSQRTGREFLLLAGQVPSKRHPADAKGFKWVQVPWDGDDHSMPTEPSESMSLLIELLEQMRAMPYVDASRIVVTGLSMGGFGTWDLLMRRPNWFAAAMPLCGGADNTKLSAVKDIPIRICHGSADRTVLTHRSVDAYRVLRSLGAKDVAYLEFPGVGHDCWVPVYDNDLNLEWLLSQRLDGSEGK